MEQSAEEEGVECGICLDVLTNPVALPCRHKFCSECLNGWRSKYGIMPGDKETNTKCPLCREKIPPSKEMLSQLKTWRNCQRLLEEKGDTFSREYMHAKSEIEKLEREIGDRTETIDYSDEDKNYVVLPARVYAAASNNDIQKVLDWLGPSPVDKQRVNAKNPEVMNYTLVFAAAVNNNSDLLSILLQLGVDVDPVDASGMTPLIHCGYKPEHYAQARLLLEWGAEISNDDRFSKDAHIGLALKHGNIKLANLLKSEFGGRRCEIINMPNRPDLIGKTCVVEKYLPDKNRYKVIFEATKEVGLLGPQNLKRRDRTPDDCGYYITYKNGKFSRYDFASEEECQAFVASLNEGGGKLGAVDAEARAEQAAADLLAELDIDSPSANSEKKSKKGKKGKKKGKK